MKEHKRYIEKNGLKEGTHLEISVYYSKGGRIYYTGQELPRGYYLSVQPVTLGYHTVRHTLFSGWKRIILKANRYSDKQFDNAVEMAKAYEEELIAKVTMKKEA